MATSAAYNDEAPSTSTKECKVANLEARIEQAEKYKEGGNEQYKGRNFKKAIGKYHRAILCLKDINKSMQSSSSQLQNILGMSSEETHMDSMPPDLAERVRGVRKSCYNNLAACLLQDDAPNYEKIVIYCQHVLDNDEANTKALYRQGVAYFHLKDYSTAHSRLKAALNNDPKDTSIRNQLKLCEDAITKGRIAEKNMYKKIFQKMNENE